MRQDTVRSIILVIGIVAGFSIVTAAGSAFAQSDRSGMTNGIERSATELPAIPQTDTIRNTQDVPAINPLREPGIVDFMTLDDPSEQTAEVMGNLERTTRMPRLVTRDTQQAGLTQQDR